MYWKGLSGVNRVNREKAKELALRRKNWRVLIVGRERVILKNFPFKKTMERSKPFAVEWTKYLLLAVTAITPLKSSYNGS